MDLGPKHTTRKNTVTRNDTHKYTQTHCSYRSVLATNCSKSHRHYTATATQTHACPNYFITVWLRSVSGRMRLYQNKRKEVAA